VQVVQFAKHLTQVLPSKNVPATQATQSVLAVFSGPILQVHNLLVVL
jgi:hypothetical protein